MILGPTSSTKSLNLGCMKKETIQCLNCSKFVEKRAAELKRQRKSGAVKFYCNLSCAASVGNKLTPRGRKFRGNIDAGRTLDELSPFRWFLGRARTRDAHHKKKSRGGWASTDCDEAYLKQVWEEQGGKCALTGWSLILPRGTCGFPAGPKYERASLDRIDSNLGYVKGNVRYISFIANIARGAFSDDELIAFCKAVVANHFIAV